MQESLEGLRESNLQRGQQWWKKTFFKDGEPLGKKAP
jgi:hypothetical protein